jgi:hypothetical protein
MNITDKKPIDLFDYSNLEKSYKELLKKHHPDVGGNQEYFLHIAECYEIAKKEKEYGYAIGSKQIFFFNPYGNTIFDYVSCCTFPYGRVYDGPSHLIYEFPGDTMKDEIKDLLGKIDFPLAGEAIEEKIKIHLPNPRRILILCVKDCAFVIFNKTGGSMLLCDVIPHKIPIETSVWMFNRLYSLGCYMQMAGIYNLDISPYTLTVDLDCHSVQLLGGWWYSVKAGKKITKLPLTTYGLLSNRMKDTKKASIEIVSEQIKNVMRIILAGRDIPKPYKNWLSLPAQENIIDEYYQWEHNVMPKIFPVREFYKWTI